MRLLDRYLVRQFLPPFLLGLLVFTFLVIIPSLIEYAEPLIAKGVSLPVVLTLLAMLVPHALALAIPMSLLLGLLVALGRLSADREFVAMQACGVSLARLLRPVSLLSIAAAAATAYVLIVSVPAANQAFRNIAFSIIAQRAEGDVRPRVFFDGFPNLVLYVREVPADGTGWKGVFLVDDRPGHRGEVYLARQGRMVIDREARTVEMVLQHGVRHSGDPTGAYDVWHFDLAVLSVDPETVFPEGGYPKGDNEMTIPELEATIAQMDRAGQSSHNPRMALQRKFSIPFACLVFGLIGLAVGATKRRGGTLGSFVIGLVVIFAYYVPLNVGPALAKGSLLPPWLAVWLPNIVLGALGVLLFAWRDRFADRPLPVPTGLPGWRRRERVRAAAAIPFVRLLDRYVTSAYVRVLLLAGFGMLAIFYISTLIDLSDKLFKGQTTVGAIARYFWYATPEYVYYTVPMSVLLAALVTIATLTRSSELVVMKACGISLYRVAVPMAVAAILAGGALFALQEGVLGPANRQKDAIRGAIRGQADAQGALLRRRWLAGSTGAIYHYEAFDPDGRQLTRLSIYEPADGMRGLVRRTFAERATEVGTLPDGRPRDWRFEDGWTRRFDAPGPPDPVVTFDAAPYALEPAAYFGASRLDAKYMNYAQLRDHTAALRASGVDVLEEEVALERKLAFPFVTVVMTLIAVPFAVTTGRRGAMAGIGVGLGIALAYWTALSLFAAIGTGGLVAPTLAAWAPNLLFAAGAMVLLLTVRT